jgi:hypothetical protein
MRTILTVVIVLMSALTVCLQAQAAVTVVNFDDLVGQAFIPANYAGISWSEGWTYYDWAQDPWNPHSTPTRVYNYGQWRGYAQPSFTFGQDVRFDGAWFADQGYATYLKLYDATNALVYTSNTIYPGSTPLFLASGYAGLVRKVEVHGANYTTCMDDLTYETAPTPELSSGALLLLGALPVGLGWWRRRKQ